jgi:hypothetical protein
MVVHVASVGLAQDLQRLEQTPPALARWYRIRLEFVLDGAGADRQPCQSAVREDVERGDILRQPQRVIERHQQEVGAQLETGRPRGDGAQPMQRRGRPGVRREVVLADPHEIQPELFAIHGVVDAAAIDLRQRLRMGGIVANRQCHADIHAMFLPSVLETLAVFPSRRLYGVTWGRRTQASECASAQVASEATMIVDVHAHCTPSAYAARLARASGPPRNAEPYPTRPGVAAPPRSDDPADIQARLALMDDAGVRMQVLSLPAGPYLADPSRRLRAHA